MQLFLKILLISALIPAGLFIIGFLAMCLSGLAGPDFGVPAGICFGLACTIVAISNVLKS